MKTTGICFLILGGVSLLISGFCFVAYFIFEKLPHKTGKTLGKLYGSKYKKDVAVWTGFGKFDGPPRVAFTIKHLTKTKYIYSVNNKHYLCAFDFWRKPHKTPNWSRVIYLKAFPYVSYLDNDENYIGSLVFLVKALFFLALAISILGLGVVALN